MIRKLKIVFHVEDDESVVVERHEHPLVLGSAATDLLAEVPLLKAALDRTDPGDGKVWQAAYLNLESAKAEARSACEAAGEAIGRFLLLRLIEEYSKPCLSGCHTQTLIPTTSRRA